LVPVASPDDDGDLDFLGARARTWPSTHGRSDTSVVSYLAYLGIVLAVGSDIVLIFGALGLVLLVRGCDSRELVRT